MTKPVRNLVAVISSLLLVLAPNLAFSSDLFLTGQAFGRIQGAPRGYVGLVYGLGVDEPAVHYSIAAIERPDFSAVDFWVARRGSAAVHAALPPESLTVEPIPLFGGYRARITGTISGIGLIDLFVSSHVFSFAGEDQTASCPASAAAISIDPLASVVGTSGLTDGSINGRRVAESTTDCEMIFVGPVNGFWLFQPALES